MPGWYRFSPLLATALLLSACAAPATSPIANAQAAPTATLELPTATSRPTDAVTEAVPHDPPDTCPVTMPPEPRFVPPKPYRTYGPNPGEFWYGTNALWTVVRGDGKWWALPHTSKGHTQKVFWWREGYIPAEEPQPDLTVTGRRLDGEAPPLIAFRATNAYASDIGSAMFVGVDVPTLGCWEITGEYKGRTLSFVVWVAP
jgi:hypothetical protein